VSRQQKPTPDASDNLDDRLDTLDEKLGNRRKMDAGAKSKTSDSSGYGNAMRMSSEFISAILVGAGLGYFIDWLVGTSPWALIVFMLLGFVAGVLSVLRSAGEMTMPYRSGQSNLPSQSGAMPTDPEDEDGKGR